MNSSNEFEFYKRVVKAVLNDEHPFEIVYQIHAKNINGKNKELTSAESLTRFPDFEGKQVSPYIFFKVLTEMSGSAEFGESLEKKFVYQQLERLATEVEDNIGDLGQDFIVTFNISTLFFTEEFKNKYLEIISKHPKISQKNIAIEMTEIYPFPVGSGREKEKKRFVQLMREMQKGGTVFALDDFNTDYSDEIVLSSFPWDVVKIDQNKFKTLIDQIASPKFASHFKDIEIDQSRRNVLDMLLDALEGVRRDCRQTPKKIICEGLREGSCPDNPKKNIPELIANYYGERLHALGYRKSTFLYQGFEINVPFGIDQLVSALKQKGMTVD